MDSGLRGNDKTDRPRGGRAAAILDGMIPPGVNTPRRDYRPYATEQGAAMSFDDLRAICALLGCNVTTVVTRILDWQYRRARLAARASRPIEGVES